MKNRLFLFGALLSTVVLCASNEDPYIPTNLPPLHPIDEKVTPETFVPELGYYFTKKASQENVLMGPCSPCVCMQICNPHNDECLYIHQNVINDPQEPIKKVREHFTVASNNQKPDLDVTIFTNHARPHVDTVRFPEGSHKKRIKKLAEVLKENGTIHKGTIHFNETPREEDAKNGDIDRTVFFKNKQPYRMNTREQEGVKDLSAGKDFRLWTYLDLQLRKKFADRVYWSHKNSISKNVNNPLFCIKKPNITKINNLPPSSEKPWKRYNDLPPKKSVFNLCADLVYWLTNK